MGALVTPGGWLEQAKLQDWLGQLLVDAAGSVVPLTELTY
jgi:hypothetical protein